MSLKRTVLEGLRLVACSKSGARTEELGTERVASVAGEEKPWNWDVRSSYCFCRGVRESEISDAALFYERCVKRRSSTTARVPYPSSLAISNQ